MFAVKRRQWLLALSLMLTTASVQATTCTASLSDLNFGSVDPFSGNVDVTGTVTYGCTKPVAELLTLLVLICINIGDGSQGDGTLSPRRMNDGSGNYLNFNLYSDIARTVIWGHSSHAFPAVEVTDTFGLLATTSIGGTRQIYGRIPAGQTTLVPGSYTNLFSGVHASVEWADGLLLPSTCSQGSTNFSFSTLATVQSQCSVSASNLDFGTQGTLTSNIDATSNVSVTCTNNTPYQVGLNDGQHFSATRRMQSLLNYVSYDLYRDAGRSLRWGDALSVDTQAGTGTGAAQSLTVYGRVPSQSSQPVGVYSDTITVTVTY